MFECALSFFEDGSRTLAGCDSYTNIFLLVLIRHKSLQMRLIKLVVIIIRRKRFARNDKTFVFFGLIGKTSVQIQVLLPCLFVYSV